MLPLWLALESFVLASSPVAVLSPLLPVFCSELVPVLAGMSFTPSSGTKTCPESNAVRIVLD